MAQTEDVWTIKGALEWTVGYLTRKGIENPRLSAEWLLSEACDMRRIELYINYERPLTMDEREVLRGYVTRRGRGEPLQYITGEVGFRHITVKVEPGVLIPRPETEVLVSEVLGMLPDPPRARAFDSTISAFEGDVLRAGAAASAGDEQADKGASSEETSSTPDQKAILVADLCTGTGCIACSLAFEHPDIRVVATDIEPRAVDLACRNAQAVGVEDRVSVIQCNLGDGVDSDLLGTFDAVVSNPPYIPTSVLADIPREVADYEPTLALDGGADGLDLFRPLATWAKVALKPGGFLACELHEDCMEAAARAAEDAGFATTRVVKDLAGKPRVIVCR